MQETPNLFTKQADYFLGPDHPRHRQYEALRAYFVENLPSAVVAKKFGYAHGSFRVLCWRFRRENAPDFFKDLIRDSIWE